MPEFSSAYLVCSTQRSGSTLLCEMLKGTGVAGCPEEFFEAVRETGLPPHPGAYLTGLARTGVGIRDELTPPEGPEYSSLVGIDDYRRHLERTFAWGATANGVFGAKLMFNQVPDLHALAGDLPEFSGLEPAQLLERLFGGRGELRYIWVSRRDKVRQAVSLWKALQTRRWRHSEGENGQATTPQYHFGGIQHLVQRLESDDRGWREFFSENGLQPLALSYEDDLERDPEGTLARALAWIGVQPAPGGTDRPPSGGTGGHPSGGTGGPPSGATGGQPLSRQADALTDEWVAAYHRDAAGARDASSASR